MENPRSRRAGREALLLALTSIPTAAGREDRVIAFIKEWVDDRSALTLTTDDAGNLLIRSTQHTSAAPPLLLEAHLDHPAFVIESVESPQQVSASFRGGVMAPYFIDGRVTHHAADGATTNGTIQRTDDANEPDQPFRIAHIEFEKSVNASKGDVVTWALPRSAIENGELHAPVCDDLAAVSAALCAMDECIASSSDSTGAAPNMQLLLTRAEEVGFIGAIAACKLGTILNGARIIALENSRSFADSPLGAGPIVRVGDRLSVFSPTLTAAVAKIAQQLEGQPERKVGAAPSKKSTESTKPSPIKQIDGFRWQRKLMPGGACEATAFQAYGHEATCVCLPLGNYHNMGDLDDVEPAAKAGAYNGAAPIKPEVISIDDFHNLVELLNTCARHLGAVEPLTTRLDKLFDDKRFVLE